MHIKNKEYIRNMSNRVILHSANNIEQSIKSLINLLDQGSVLMLRGDIGAGKTTLVRNIMKIFLDDDDVSVTSPTFSIVHEYYRAKDGMPIYHMDLYRLEEKRELYEIGLNEMISRGIVFIEWPSLAEEIVSEEAIQIIECAITSLPYMEGSRVLEWELVNQ